MFMMDKSYISKQESGNLESTRSRKISTYLSVKEARTIKETRTPAIASNLNSTSVKALSFDLFKLRPGYLAFRVSKAQFRSWATEGVQAKAKSNE